MHSAWYLAGIGAHWAGFDEGNVISFGEEVVTEVSRLI